jgi:hypothetical protein
MAGASAALPRISAGELICGLVFHGVAPAGTLGQHVKALTGKTIPNGALAQRRARSPLTIPEQLKSEALVPKADRRRHPDVFFSGGCGGVGGLRT